VRDAFKDFAHLHLDAQFLPQLPRQTFLKRLIRLTFAARKFPQPAQVRAFVPLRDEEFAVAKDEAGADFNGFHNVMRET